jgi:ferredoxin
MNEKIAPGLYRHYKGNFYRVIGVARHSETGEEMVVYGCLYGDCSLWVRPLAMFAEAVTVDDNNVPRFQRYEEKNVSITVDWNRCKGCGRCVSVCRDRLISLESHGGSKIAVMGERRRCELCGRCIAECLFRAISLRAMSPEKC